MTVDWFCIWFVCVLTLTLLACLPGTFLNASSCHTVQCPTGTEMTSPSSQMVTGLYDTEASSVHWQGEGVHGRSCWLVAPDGSSGWMFILDVTLWNLRKTTSLQMTFVDVLLSNTYPVTIRHSAGDVVILSFWNVIFCFLASTEGFFFSARSWNIGGTWLWPSADALYWKH